MTHFQHLLLLWATVTPPRVQLLIIIASINLNSVLTALCFSQ